jgi:hypothetical protein
MFFLCLIAALSGTPLRQSEAASDFVRAIGAFCDAGDVLAEPDGGVGDDHHETITEAGVSHRLACCAALSFDSWAELDCPPPSALAPLHFDRSVGEPANERAPWPRRGATRRQAWLQRYLF